MTDDIEQKGWLALEFLRKTDDEHATLEREAKRAEHRYKKTIDARFMVIPGAVEVRKTAARLEAEPLYIDFLDTQAKADAIRNKRATGRPKDLLDLELLGEG